jgi:hypothetical protein
MTMLRATSCSQYGHYLMFLFIFVDITFNICYTATIDFIICHF